MTQRVYNKPNISNDKKLTGWYKTNQKEQVALRVGDNQLEVDGTIRFHNGKFQGFNGHTWVELNAEKGNDGNPGKDFNQLVKIETVHEIVNSKNLTQVGQADINITTESVTSDYKLKLRNLKAGKGINILQSDKSIVLESNPQQFKKKITNMTVSDLKKDQVGDISIYTVAPNNTIKKGQAVQIINIDNTIYVKPINYTTEYINLFNSGISMLGISTNNCKSGEECQVCTKGICQALINNDSPYSSSLEIKTNNIGVVSRLGGILNLGMKPLDNFISAGYFLEDGNLGINDNLVLFYVDPKIVYF